MTTLLTPSSAAAVVVVPTTNAPASPPAKIDWEQAITQLLADLSGIQQELLAVLAEKRLRLASVDVAGMGEVQTREQALLERLQVCHAQREALLAAAKNEGLPADSMTSLAKTAVATGSSAGTAGGEKLRKELASTASRMRLLQTQSLTNWVVAQRSLLHVSQLLEIIATGGRLQPTYGVGEGVHARGGLVDHDA